MGIHDFFQHPDIIRGGRGTLRGPKTMISDTHIDIQGVSGGIVNILEGGSMDYSE